MNTEKFYDSKLVSIENTIEIIEDVEWNLNLVIRYNNMWPNEDVY